MQRVSLPSKLQTTPILLDLPQHQPAAEILGGRSPPPPSPLTLTPDANFIPVRKTNGKASAAKYQIAFTPKSTLASTSSSHEAPHVNGIPNGTASNFPSLHPGQPRKDSTGNSRHQYPGQPIMDSTGNSRHQYPGQPIMDSTGTFRHQYLGQPIMDSTGNSRHQYPGQPIMDSTGTFRPQYLGQPIMDSTGNSCHQYPGQPRKDSTGIFRPQYPGQPIMDSTGKQPSNISTSALNGQFRHDFTFTGSFAEPRQYAGSESERILGDLDLKLPPDNENQVKKKNRNPVHIPEHITIVDGDPVFYQCVCTRKFKTKANIKYHAFCQNTELLKPLKCEQCGQGFVSKSHYEYHIRTHTGERPYVCTICDKGFNQRSKVTRHMRFHTGEKPFVCPECGRGYTNAQAMRSHYLIHTGEFPFACEFCEKRFTGLTNLKKHIRTHTGERPFTCQHCGKSFGLKWTLTLHLRTHSDERPYPCDQCSRAFSNGKDLRRHMVIHSGQRPFKCSICGIAFRRKDNLERHIKNAHNQTGEVAKQLASEAATTTGYLASTSSAAAASASGSSTSAISACGTRYNLKPATVNTATCTRVREATVAKPAPTRAIPLSARINARSKSMSTPPPRPNSSPAALNLTMSSAGNTQKNASRPNIKGRRSDPNNFLCDRCGKSFGLKWTLTLHIRTHSGERPYACEDEECTRAFSNKKDLRRHMVIHTGQRPFNCSICGTAFRRYDNLLRHIKETHNQACEVAKQLANEVDTTGYLASTSSAFAASSSDPSTSAISTCGTRFNSKPATVSTITCTKVLEATVAKPARTNATPLSARISTRSKSMSTPPPRPSSSPGALDLTMSSARNSLKNARPNIEGRRSISNLPANITPAAIDATTVRSMPGPSRIATTTPTEDPATRTGPATNVDGVPGSMIVHSLPNAVTVIYIDIYRPEHFIYHS